MVLMHFASRPHNIGTGSIEIERKTLKPEILVQEYNLPRRR